MFQKLDLILLMVKCRLYTFLTDEDGDVNIVSMVVLIGIVVLLAIIFRDVISKLITDLLAVITENATKAVNGD